MPETMPQATSSHMMKVTKRGRPYLKVPIHPLLNALSSDSPLQGYLGSFRHLNSFPRAHQPQAVFPHLPELFHNVCSFLSHLPKPPQLTHLPFVYSDEAARNLASLKFSQSNRGPDPREPSRIITTTTTTTFSMTRDMAKAMCQHFMDARLIENAVDPSSNLFKERGVYQLTPKGLHVLERFISKNGINADHISHVFQTQPICMKLLHLERRSVDDEIIVSQAVITALFRRFVGRQPNYPPDNFQSLDPHHTYQERSKGLALMDVTERSQAIMGRSTTTVQKYCFAAVAALEWLCDFTSVIGREEAAEMAAQFVRFGLITLVSDKRKNNDSAIIFTVRGSAPAGSSIGVSSNSSSSVQSGPHLFRSNTVNSVAPPRQSIVSPTKAVALPVGMPSPRTLQTTLPSMLPLLRETPPRAMILNFTVGLQPPTNQRTRRRRPSRNLTLIDYGTSLKNPHYAAVSASSYAKTFVKRICRSGSRLRISRESSALLPVPWPPLPPVAVPRPLVRRRWNGITKR